MTVRIGVIGVGAIGQDHIARLISRVAGAQVVAVADVDLARAEGLAKDVGVTRAYADSHDLISDHHVDAVVVASWGPTHEEFVLACLAADKDVFCEKPLAPSPDSCRRIVDAEVAHGRRRIQVGFMRRYDSGYLAMKAALDRRAIGMPLLAHCTHRNPSAPPYGFTSDMIMTDSAVHDIDTTRWLFDEEIAAVTVHTPRSTTANNSGLTDPQLLLIETDGGALIDVELFVNCDYGYDVRCEVVGETGTLSLGDGSDVVLRQGGHRADRVPADWRERFVDAYDLELQAWVDAVASGTATGPSAWDGYAAAVVSERCLTALHNQQRTPVAIEQRPELYASPPIQKGPA